MIGPITILAALLVLPQGNARASLADGVNVAAAGPAHRPTALRESLANLDYSAVEASSAQPPSAVQDSTSNTSSKPKRSMSSKVAGGVLGAAAGFFAGRYFGQAIGGLGGFIIGGPIGAIAGGVLGVKF